MIPLGRPREVGAQAEHSLFEYQAGLREAELRDRVDGLATEPLPAGHRNLGRLWRVALLWTVVVLAMGAVATWFLDTVMAVETVSVVTAIVIVTIRGRRRPASRQDRAG